ILVGINTGAGKENPRVFELKERFTQEPESERSGSNPDRAWRTRAAAAPVRNPAITTAGGGEPVSGEAPVASRTAPANESRIGAGLWACTESAQSSARISGISSLLADAMEIEIDVGVEVTGNVETFGHACGERLARNRKSVV